jgi:hypothetical protein
MFKFVKKSPSNIDELIPPEIISNDFVDCIKQIASKAECRTYVEIGSSSGYGSTQAILNGIRIKNNLDRKESSLYCFEISKPRAQIFKSHISKSEARMLNLSTILPEEFPTIDRIKTFYNSIETTINNFPLTLIQEWYKQDLEYLKANPKCIPHFNGSKIGGIDYLKLKLKVDTFDFVLIDGSEFTGLVELSKVWGSMHILLDDVNSFKNYESYMKLKSSQQYVLMEENWHTRNGWAAFKRLVP